MRDWVCQSLKISLPTTLNCGDDALTCFAGQCFCEKPFEFQSPRKKNLMVKGTFLKEGSLNHLGVLVVVEGTNLNVL